MDEEERVAKIKKDAQLALLANYIMAKIPGEPSQSQGAGQTAIRIMETYRIGLQVIGARLVEMGEIANEAGLMVMELVDGPSALMKDEEE